MSVKTKFSYRLIILAWMIFFVFLCLYFWDPVENGDVWWHLATGRWIIQHNQVPHWDIFAFNKPNPWILTQWLGSVFYFICYGLGGLVGLKVLRVILCLLPIGLFALHTRRKVPPLAILVLAYLLAMSLYTRCMLRPFLLNFIFISIFLITLVRFKENGQAWYLMPIPLLGILWVNIHMGSFVYGGLLLGCFLLESFIGLLRNLKDNRPDWRKAAYGFKGLGAVSILYLLVFFLNPYGLQGTLHPLRVFLIPDYIHFPHLSAHIKELLPPDYIFSVRGGWVIGLFLITTVSILSQRRREMALILIWLISLMLFMRSQRGSVFFALASVYTISEYWPRALLSRIVLTEAQKEIIHRSLIGVFIILLVAGTGRKIQKYYVVDGISRSVLAQRLRHGPREVVAFMWRNNLHGPVFCDDQTGDFLLWCCYPRFKPFIDTRQVDFESYYQYFEAILNPQRFWPRAEERHGIRIVLLNSDAPTYRLIPYFAGRPDWQLIEVKGDHMLFVKKGAFVLPAEILARWSRWQATEIRPEDFMRLKALVALGPRSAFQRWVRPAAGYFDLIEEGVSLLDASLGQEALRRFIAAMEIDPVAVRERVSM